MNLKDLKLDALKELSKMDKDDFLQVVGLETKKGTTDYLIPGLLVFGAGLAVGCGIGMLLAPRAGAELRGQIGDALGQGIAKGKEQAQQMKDKVAVGTMPAGQTVS